MSRREKIHPIRERTSLSLIILMVIVPDLRYVIVSIFPQERFKIGLPSIKIWDFRILQRKQKPFLFKRI